MSSLNVDLIEKSGTDAETLVKVLKERSEKEDMDSIFFIEMVLACVDYTEFFKMMLDYHRRKQDGEV